MRTKVLSGIALTGVCFFLLGRWSVSKDITIYQGAYNHYIAVHRDWPTYGLPLAEESAILTSLRHTNFEYGIGMLETQLDWAILDAAKRRKVLSKNDRKELEAALVMAAKYRAAFPRNHPPINGASSRDELQKAEEIDSFLLRFTKGVPND